MSLPLSPFAPFSDDYGCQISTFAVTDQMRAKTPALSYPPSDGHDVQKYRVKILHDYRVWVAMVCSCFLETAGRHWNGDEANTHVVQTVKKVQQDRACVETDSADMDSTS